MSVTFKATYIGIGTYKFEPVGKVVVKESHPAMRIVVRDPTKPSKDITIEIIPRYIIKAVFHFGTNSTLLFRVEQNTIENVQQLIRPNEDSSVAQCQWIIVKTSALSQSDINLLRDIYVCFTEDEITSEEMDEMVKCYTTDKRKVRGIRQPHNASSKSTHDVQIVQRILEYPPNSKGAISISVKDYECLARSKYLNDVIIDFYMKYLYNEILTPEQRQKTYIFNTFFYKALTTTPRGSIATLQLTVAQKRHERVKKWTKNVNIFEKDFIIIPINQNDHWFLAIICFPGLKGAVNMKTGETVQAKNPTTRKTTDLNDDESEIAIKQPCILIFDSLGGGRLEEIDIIRDYLTCEYAAKMNEARQFSFFNMQGSSVCVPSQPNLWDCGLFLLQYAEQFFTDPIKSYDLPINGLMNWFAEKVATRKRKDIAELIKTKMQHQNNGFPVADLPDITLPK